MTTRILLIGGHGKVALLAEPLLVEAGHHVTAVIRNPDHEADVQATGATPLVADVQSFDDEQMRNLVSGNDVVVWSAGAGGGDPERTYAVDRDAAIRSMDAAVAAGVPEDIPFFAYAEAKAAADEHLRAADLDATILAPSSLTEDDGTGMIDTEAAEAGSVARADVAGVIAAVIADDSTIGRTIRFNNGDTPIAEAVRA